MVNSNMKLTSVSKQGRGATLPSSRDNREVSLCRMLLLSMPLMIAPSISEAMRHLIKENN
jgi:hypothetical protein